MLSEFI